MGAVSSRNTEELVASIRATQVALATAAERLDQLLRHERVTVDDWQDAAADVGTSMARAREHLATINSKLDFSSASDALLHFFQKRVGKVVTAAQLEGVAGISSWSRRVRELGERDGWSIDSGVEQPELRPDKYMLTSLKRNGR